MQGLDIKVPITIIITTHSLRGCHGDGNKEHVFSSWFVKKEIGTQKVKMTDLNTSADLWQAGI